MATEPAQLDAELVESFMRGFYGYGDYTGDVWFIGMEEGGADSLASIAAHLGNWHDRGRGELEDVRDFHLAKGNDHWFDESPPLQRTWKGLARILLGGSESVDVEQVRQTQAHQLGRIGGDNCLLELLPLPSPSTAHWPYADCTTDPVLSSRERYRDEVAPWRAAHLRVRIEEHRPRVVLFYGMSPVSYVDWWRTIAGADLEEVELAGHRTFLGHNSSTRFIVTKHMVAHGISNDFLDTVGRLVAAARPSIAPEETTTSEPEGLP